MNLEFWIEEVERLYKDGLSLQRAVLLVQFMKEGYEPLPSTYFISSPKRFSIIEFIPKLKSVFSDK